MEKPSRGDFSNKIYGYMSYEKRLYKYCIYLENILKKQEKINKIQLEIHKDLAVKFAEWIRENYYDVGDSWCEWNSDKNTYSSKELLEKFIISNENDS
jgi:hypothetical protein